MDDTQNRSTQTRAAEDPDRLARLGHRWGISAKLIYRWTLSDDKQLALLIVGMRKRDEAKEPLREPIKNLSAFVQSHGVYIKDVARLSGLTRQTLDRLSRRPRTVARLRDLVAGVEEVLTAAAEKGDG